MSKTDQQRTRRVRKGSAAQQLLDNALFQGAFTTVEDLIIQQLKEAKLNGSSEQEQYIFELVRRLQTLDGVKAAVHQVVQSGRLTEQAFRPQEEVAGGQPDGTT